VLTETQSEVVIKEAAENLPLQAIRTRLKKPLNPKKTLPSRPSPMRRPRMYFLNSSKGQKQQEIPLLVKASPKETKTKVLQTAILMPVPITGTRPRVPAPQAMA